MIIQHHFSNLNDWINYSEQDLTADEPDSNRQSCCVKPGWQGVKTKREAYDLFWNGHPAGLAQMKRILEGIESGIQLPSYVDVFENDVAGCAPDINSYLQGIPEDMFVISQIPMEAPPEQLTVQLEMCMSGGFDTKTTAMAGAILFAAAQALRMQGCNVHFLLCYTFQMKDYKVQFSVDVPNHLDLDTLAFLFTHPACFRVIVFSMMEHEPHEIRRIFNAYTNGGYGYPGHEKIERSDVMLTLQKFCIELRNEFDTPENIPAMQTKVRQLIDSKFQMNHDWQWA